jgi:hypothetical protein
MENIVRVVCVTKALAGTSIGIFLEGLNEKTD